MSDTVHALPALQLPLRRDRFGRQRLLLSKLADILLGVRARPRLERRAGRHGYAKRAANVVGVATVENASKGQLRHRVPGHAGRPNGVLGPSLPISRLMVTLPREHHVTALPALFRQSDRACWRACRPMPLLSIVPSANVVLLRRQDIVTIAVIRKTQHRHLSRLDSLSLSAALKVGSDAFQRQVVQCEAAQLTGTEHGQESLCTRLEVHRAAGLHGAKPPAERCQQRRHIVGRLAQAAARHVVSVR